MWLHCYSTDEYHWEWNGNNNNSEYSYTYATKYLVRKVERDLFDKCHVSTSEKMIVVYRSWQKKDESAAMGKSR